MTMAANRPEAMSRIPFAERYPRESGSVPAGTPYPAAAAAVDGAKRNRALIKMIHAAITPDE